MQLFLQEKLLFVDPVYVAWRKWNGSGGFFHCGNTNRAANSNDWTNLAITPLERRI
jgi:hypothetical protein